MGEALGQLREALVEYASGFEAGLLSVADARAALAQAMVIESTAATIKALAASRVARGGGDARRRGARSGAHDLLDKLCRFHHRLKTNEGWALVEGTGKRDFVPPDDPRHPRHKRRAA
jgi:hypothetical protein